MKHGIINFQQIDSWFFRESRPHGSVGANALSSVFPPPTRTLMGAIRSQIGYQYFANNPSYSWDDLDNLPQLQAVIGNANHLGSLQPKGVFLQQQINDQTTYFLPAPSNICSKAEDNKHHFIAFGLTPEPYQTDIGKIQLPTLPDKVDGLIDSRGFKPLENTWISTKVWQAILNGDISQVNKLSSQIYQLEDFMTGEYRLGIELQTPYRSIKEGQLYQTTHLRLNTDVSIFMPVQYDDEHLQQLNVDIVNKKSLVRLGGEARMASVQFDSDAIEYLPKVPEKFTDNKPNAKKHFMLYFISKLSMETGWLPAGFKQNATQNGFVGNINGIEMTILSACIGKAY